MGDMAAWPWRKLALHVCVQRSCPVEYKSPPVVSFTVAHRLVPMPRRNEPLIGFAAHCCPVSAKAQCSIHRLVCMPLPQSIRSSRSYSSASACLPCATLIASRVPTLSLSVAFRSDHSAAGKAKKPDRSTGQTPVQRDTPVSVSR